MARFTSASLTAVVSLSSAVRAWNDFQIASRVQADAATPVSVDIDSDAVGYRIYLATTPPGWGTGPVCWLVNYTDISVTSVDVTIPASVVPDGTSVSLSYSGLEYSNDDGYVGSSYDYSNDFDLEGGTGEWGALELGGFSITSPDNTPCTALQCTRDCGNTYYPDGTIDYPEDEDEVTSEFLDTYKSFYNCVVACPGNEYPSYEEMMGDDGDDDDDDDDIYATASASSYESNTYYETASGIASASTSGTASATTASLTTQTTASSAKPTGASLSSAASETASTKSASSAASATSTVTTNSAGRAGLATTAVLVCCMAMLFGV